MPGPPINKSSYGTGHYLWPGGPGSDDFLQEKFSRPTRRAMENFRGPLDIARQFFDAHSLCKIFMYFRVELKCKLCRFDCISEGYWGLTKDAASAAKIFPENNFDAPSGLLNIFSMPTL